MSISDTFDDQWINNFSNYKHTMLKKLFLLNDGSFKTSIFCLKNLINLTHLTLLDCRSNDDQLQEIFEHLKHLQYFELNDINGEHPTLSDYGFTGGKAGFSISNLQKLKLLYISMDKSVFGEPTLKHIMKIKSLEYLYIRCNEDEMSVSYMYIFA